MKLVSGMEFGWNADDNDDDDDDVGLVWMALYHFVMGLQREIFSSLITF